jgi:hypothetical protein
VADPLSILPQAPGPAVLVKTLKEVDTHVSRSSQTQPQIITLVSIGGFELGGHDRADHAAAAE